MKTKIKSPELTSSTEAILARFDSRVKSVCADSRAEIGALEKECEQARSELKRLAAERDEAMEEGDYERFRTAKIQAATVSDEIEEYTARINALKRRCLIPPEECEQMGRQINREVIGQFADFAEEYIRLRQEMASLANRYGYVFRYSNDLLSRILYTVHYQSKLDAGGAIRFLHYGVPQQLPDLMLANIARFLRDPVYQNINIQELRRHNADIKGGE